MRPHAIALARNVLDLNETESLELADWYHTEAHRPDLHVKHTAWQRSKGAYERFLELHARQDAARLNATRAISDADVAISKLPIGGSFQRVRELLHLIDVDKDIIRGYGYWHHDKGTLSYDGPPMWGGQSLRICYEPPAEYDFDATFEIHQPYQYDRLAFNLSEGGRFFSAYVDIARHLAGIEGWKDDQAFKSTPSLDLKARHELHVTVRTGQISMYLDGKLAAQTRTDVDYVGVHFGLPPDWQLVGAIGVISDSSPIRFSAMRVVEIKGRGRPLHLAPLGRIATLPGSLPDDKPARVVKLNPLIDTKANAVTGVWTRKGNDICSDGGPYVRLSIPYKLPEEYDLRVSFTCVDGWDEVALLLAEGNRNFAFYLGSDASTTIGFANIAGEPSASANAVVRSPALLRNDQTHTAIVYVRRDFIAASIDGKLVASCKTDFSNISQAGEWSMKPGQWGIGTNFRAAVFHSIEIAEIANKNQAPAPDVGHRPE